MSNANAAKKKLDEKHLKILKELVAHDTNKHCFDCKQRGPTYVNVTIGSYVCTNCGGALRKYNHRVKSMVMSTFTPQEMEFLMKRGNEACRKIYFGLNDGKCPPEVDISDDRHLDDHLRQKYERKKWYVEPSPSVEEAAIAINQPIYDRAEKGGGIKNLSSQQNQFARMPNASAGLIMPAPSRSVPKTTSATTLTSGTTSISRPSSTTLVGPPTQSTASASTAFSFSNGGNAAAAIDPFASTPATTARQLSISDPFGPPLSPFSSLASASRPSVPSGGGPPPPLSTNSSLFPSSNSGSSFSSTPNSYSGNTNVDKYAALKELDGLFGGGPTTTGPTPAVAPSSNHSINMFSGPASSTSTGQFWAQPPTSVIPPAADMWSTASIPLHPPPSYAATVPGGGISLAAAAPAGDPFHVAPLPATANPFFAATGSGASSWNAPAFSTGATAVPQQPFGAAAPPVSTNLFATPPISTGFGAPNPFNPFMTRSAAVYPHTQRQSSEYPSSNRNTRLQKT